MAKKKILEKLAPQVCMGLIPLLSYPHHVKIFFEFILGNVGKLFVCTSSMIFPCMYEYYPFE